MTNKFLLNLLGFNPDLTTRQSRVDSVSIASRLRVLGITMLCLLTIGSGNAWGADVTGTINFGSASESTNINAASVTGDDSQDNTWTVTTVGTTSFTPNAAYAQVGSSKKPATSITFTTTLPSAQTITSMSAKFGGFSGTAGTVTLKVGDNSIGTGSLSESSDVTVNSTDATKSGTVLTVTVTGISKGVKCYYISYTYSTGGGSKYTVSFNTGTGNPSQADITEASGGAGITLPSVTPTCSGDGWALYGWATSACSPETSTAPTIVGKAGDNYHPSGDITLHAVYAKGEYTKETSSITSGSKYLIVANSTKNYIMTDIYSLNGEEGEMASAQVDETSSNKYHAAVINANWCYTIEGSAANYYIRDVKNSSSANYVDIAYKNWYGKGVDSGDKWTITVSSGNWTLMNNYFSNYLGFNTSTKVFYRASGTTFYLYRQTTAPSYFSNPTCCTELASINGSFF